MQGRKTIHCIRSLTPQQAAGNALAVYFQDLRDQLHTSGVLLIIRSGFVNLPKTADFHKGVLVSNSCMVPAELCRTIGEKRDALQAIYPAEHYFSDQNNGKEYHRALELLM